jgi:hypothetical protein
MYEENIRDQKTVRTDKSFGINLKKKLYGFPTLESINLLNFGTVGMSELASIF